MRKGIHDVEEIRNTFIELERQQMFEGECDQQLMEFLYLKIESTTNDIDPDIVFGVDMENKINGNQYDEIPTHLLIAGGTGSGKSNLMKYVHLQLLQKKINSMIIEPSITQEFNGLIHYGDVYFLNLTTPNLVNLIIPPRNVDRREWDVILSEVFRVNLKAQYSVGILVELLRELYEMEYPHLSDLIELVRIRLYQRKGADKERQYLGTLYNVLRQIPYIEAFTCRQGILPKILDMDKSVVLRTNLNTTGAKLMIEFIFLYISYHLASRERKSKDDVFVLSVDEAQRHIFAKQPLGTQNIATQLLAEALRKAGIGVILIAQSPSARLDVDAINNTATKVCFRLHSNDEIRSMSQHLMIQDEYLLEQFYSLRVGQAILKKPSGEPVMIETEEVRLPKVSKQEIDEHMRPILKELSDEEESFEKSSEVQIPVETDVEEQQPDIEQTEQKQDTLDVVYLQIKMVEIWHANPFPCLTDFDSKVRDATKLSYHQARKLREEITYDKQKGNELTAIFTKERIDGTGKRGRPLEAIFLTDFGKEYVTKALKKTVPTEPRGGSPAHTFTTYKIRSFWKDKCHSVEIGKTVMINDQNHGKIRKEVDLQLILNDSKQTRICYEVNHTGTDRLQDDVMKLLYAQPKFDKIIVVNILASERKKVNRVLKPLLQDYPKQIVLEDVIRYLQSRKEKR